MKLEPSLKRGEEESPGHIQEKRTPGRGNSKCLRRESDRHVRGTARSQAEEEGLWEGGGGETMGSDCMPP